MKYILAILFIFIGSFSFAQIKKENIYGTWMGSKIIYKDGTELSYDNVLKYMHLKYTFKASGIVNLSVVYFENGPNNSYDLNYNYLTIKSPQGYVINVLRIEAVKDTLILLQEGQQGFDDPLSLKYYFVPEMVYKKSLKLTPDDIHSVIAGDTIYNECPKVYANYKGASFQEDVYKNIDDIINMDGRSGHFVAMFTVFKSGIADSVKILQGIDEEFNKRFIKVFNHLKKNWNPAILNEKPVDVNMMIHLHYSTVVTNIASDVSSKQAKTAYNNKQYDLALYCYDIVLKADSTNKDNLYWRGMCKMVLGNNTGACEDWNKIKALGNTPEIDAILKKYCK